MPIFSPLRSKISPLRLVNTPLWFQICSVRAEFALSGLRSDLLGINLAFKLPSQVSNLPSSLTSYWYEPSSQSLETSYFPSKQSNQYSFAPSQDVCKPLFPTGCYPFGAAALLSVRASYSLQLLTKSRASGTADHVRSLDCLLPFFQFLGHLTSLHLPKCSRDQR